MAGRYTSRFAGSALIVLSLALAWVPAGSASAAFPGANGRVAFVRYTVNGARIATVLPDGSGFTWLSRRGSHDAEPAWSSDGTRLVFQRCCRTGYWQIWTMGAGGQSPVNVSRSSTNDTNPSVGPDGRIAFVRGGDIWVLAADGSGAVRLTISSGYTEDAPAWSPDGRWIVYQRCCYGTLGGGAWQIFRMKADGTDKMNLSANAGATMDFRPDWSPDGTRIVFERYDGVTLDRIWLMNADGTAKTEVNADQNGAKPAFSPDGTRIVFYGPPPISGSAGIYTMTLTGSGITTVSWGFDPVWQPLPR